MLTKVFSQLALLENGDDMDIRLLWSQIKSFTCFRIMGLRTDWFLNEGLFYITISWVELSN